MICCTFDYRENGMINNFSSDGEKRGLQGGLGGIAVIMLLVRLNLLQVCFLTRVFEKHLAVPYLSEMLP